MKKFLASALMLLAASTATFAQHAVGSFTLQPKVGLNIASLTKNDGGDPRYGVAAGAELEYQAGDIFSLSFGALYSQQGAKNGDATYKLDYVNVPIMANVYVAKGLAVKLGVQPGFNVNSEISGTYAGWKASSDVDAKSVDFSIPVGMSYELPTVPLVIDARYNIGVTKMAEGDESRNRTFQFTIGYKKDL